MSRLARAGAAALVALLASTQPLAQTAEERAMPPTVLVAKLALDEYFGDREKLDQAALALNIAKVHHPDSADMYVQAARLVIKGRHVPGMGAGVNASDAYLQLLDKAISLDGRHAKARILKAEALNMRGDFKGEKAALDKAQSLGTTDPWLWMGYGRHHQSIDDPTSAYYDYLRVRKAGPGDSGMSRTAYVQALLALVRFKPSAGEKLVLKDLAEAARKARHPRDDRTLSNFAAQFGHVGQFDDAIAYARDALNTRESGHARLNLAAALVGRAAQHQRAGSPASARALVAQARKNGFDRDEVLARLAASTVQVQQLLPTAEQLLR